MIAVERAAYGVDFSAGEPTDLGQLKLHAPFFRFPGFADTADLRNWFADNNVAIFGTDLRASDWVPMTSQQELKLIMGRLEKAGARHAPVSRQPPMDCRHDAGVFGRAEEARLSRRPCRRRAGHGADHARPAGWISETGRVTGALKPRMDKYTHRSGRPVPGPASASGIAAFALLQPELAFRTQAPMACSATSRTWGARRCSKR